MSSWKGSTKPFRVLSVAIIVVVISLVSVAIAQSFRSGKLASSYDEAWAQRMAAFADVPLAIEQDDDAPLRIVNASVKKVSKADFESLTGDRTELIEVLTAPTVKLQNVSEKVIRRVSIIIDNPEGLHSKGIMMKDLKVGPGEFLNITPENFVAGQDRISTVDDNGKYEMRKADISKSKRFWLPFSDVSKLKIRVSVEFQDGEKWYNRSQREGGAE